MNIKYKLLYIEISVSEPRSKEYMLMHQNIVRETFS